MIFSRYIAASISRKGPLRIVFVLLYFLVIAAISFGLTRIGLRISDRANIIVGVSIVTALMCAVAVLVFQIRQTTMRDDLRLVARDRESVDDFFYIVLWTITIGLFLTLFLVLPDIVVISDNELTNKIYSFIGFLVIIHFAIVLGQFVVRFARLYDRIAAKMK